MSSGKSGQWCDANLSCLRISTPQKPWSPTAELKTCWPPTMDSRSHHLPALGSTAPFYPWQPWTSSFAQVPELHWRPTLGSPTIPPLTLSLPRILSSVSFLLPQCRSRVSASLRFLLSQVFFLYLERSGSVFVCLLALATFSVFSTYFPSPSFLLPPMPPPCALTVNVEPGSTDATTLVSSFLLAKRVPKRIGHGNIGTDWLTV